MSSDARTLLALVFKRYEEADLMVDDDGQQLGYAVDLSDLEDRIDAALRATPVDEAAPGECCDLRDRLHLALLPGRRLNDDEIIDAVLALSDAKHACNCETPCEVHDRESATPPTCSCAAHKCEKTPLYCRDCADCCVEPSRRGRATR